MNERIRQFAEQAGITTNLDTDYFEKDMNKWVDYFSEKFAELIVRECIAKAEEESERYLSWSTEDCDRFAKVMQNYQELLKEHFGVKG